MAHNPDYTKYHPKWYRQRTPIFWWVRKWPYVKFITRELTSIFVALYALLLLCEVRALGQGPAAFASFSAWLKSPVSIGLHIVALCFVLFHSITWFNLAPKAMVFRLGKTRVPDVVIAASNFLGWGMVSAVIAWIVLRV